MDKIVDTFIETANAFDVEGILALFGSKAVIEDASVGQSFAGKAGVRRYVQEFFVGYKTMSKLLSLERIGDCSAIARIDFTGNFGHEIGSLRIRIDSAGLIERIDADLE
ncbi:nuclear transport factor 2 family protein [Massilia sp. HP4]|uniref:nuclear transport factor 2 family protein n=1 Tax=Massilia sp. HP4 TaxID=2562316 RepID=UPI0010C1294B|nr:nuclear transport factor 2 family protein [Massilia sp. HP4]